MSEPRHKTIYGQRAKLGLIIPPTNTVNEVEWQIMAPEGVSVHTTRMALHEDTGSPEGERALYHDIRQAVSDLAQARLDVIAYGCTAGSMVLPMEKLSNFMGEVANITGVTTAASIVMALRALKAEQIAIATPYHDELNQHEAEFLQKSGFEILTIKGLGIGAGGPQEYIQIAQTPYEIVYQHILASDHQDAQAILVSCTDFPVLGMIAQLESDLGKPVITSNQATFWASIRAAGLDDKFDNYGKLLKQH